MGCLGCAGALLLLLAGCGSQPQRAPETSGAVPPELTSPKPPRKGGGYYQDDGPADTVPVDLAAIPDAVPREEPLRRAANKPYTVLGRDYQPFTELRPYKARGIGSWYGRKFHGQKTSIGEPYDMFAMTAAHTTLPLPSYVRVTNLANGKSVVVRVNDRGPFLHGRIIDLSYAAAWKLGYVDSGSAMVEVESVLPADTRLASTAPAASPAPVQPASVMVPATDAADPIADLLAAAPPAEDPPLPTEHEARGYFLQIGAFGSRENAESFRARIARQLEGSAELLQVYLKGGMYRLHLGPYRDAQEAARVAERVRQALDVQPFVVQR